MNHVRGKKFFHVVWENERGMKLAFARLASLESEGLNDGTATQGSAGKTGATLGWNAGSLSGFLSQMLRMEVAKELFASCSESIGLPEIETNHFIFAAPFPRK